MLILPACLSACCCLALLLLLLLLLLMQVRRLGEFDGGLSAAQLAADPSAADIDDPTYGE